MERVSNQAADVVVLAKRALLWIVYAFRPLQIQEIQHALAVREEDTDVDDEALTPANYITSVCAGLVTIDEQSNIIRLVHYTAREYFERMQSEYFSDARVVIASACLRYLSFNIFAEGFSTSDQGLPALLAKCPFLLYAAQNWGAPRTWRPRRSDLNPFNGPPRT
jgi:hypothetical protein